MNRKDYETYIKYKEQKSKLCNDFPSKYNDSLIELNNAYSDSMDTIKEIEYVINNKYDSLTGIIIEIIELLLLELSLWYPFIMGKGIIIPLSIFLIVFFHFSVVAKILPKIKIGIECYIKYNKMMKK